MSDNTTKLKFVRVSPDGRGEEELGSALSYVVPRSGEMVVLKGKRYKVRDHRYNVVPLKEMVKDRMMDGMEELGDLMSELAEVAHGERELLAVSDVTIFVVIVEKIP